jgi:hypothetical protein
VAHRAATTGSGHRHAIPRAEYIRGAQHLAFRMESAMPYIVDFASVSTVGLESSPVAAALAGLRANEVSSILREERGIVIASRPLEAVEASVDGIRWTHVFYESGLAINVLYTLADAGKRAVGFKLSEGMDVPEELATFKFVRQRSKLAGTIRGSYFVIKGTY